MGSVTDFLFNGSPPPSVTAYGTSNQNIPTWLSDASLGLVNKANAIAGQDYTAYGGPRIAGFTNDQTAAQQAVRDNALRYQPAMDSAVTGTAGTMGLATPYYDTAAANMNAAGSTINGALAASTPGYNAAMGQYGAASQGYDASIAPGQGGLATALPWLNAASGTFTGNTVNQYMNPFTSNVIDAATLAANRNFQNTIMPQLADTFTANGQFGSSAHETAANRAAYDLTTGLQTNALAALAQAYNSGQGAFQNDMSRYAGLAGTAGSLGTAQQAAMQAAAAGKAGVGNDIANTTTAQGNLGLAAGADLGTLGNNQAALGTNIANTNLNVNAQQAQLAAQAQKAALTGAGALDASGQAQQALQQQSLNTAYQDFQNQQNWSKQQLDWLNSIVKGVPYSTSASATQTIPQGTTTGSTFDQLGGVLSSIYGGAPAAKTAARGGLIRAYKRGGLVTRRGALAAAVA